MESVRKNCSTPLFAIFSCGDGCRSLGETANSENTLLGRLDYCRNVCGLCREIFDDLKHWSGVSPSTLTVVAVFFFFSSHASSVTSYRSDPSETADNKLMEKKSTPRHSVEGDDSWTWIGGHFRWLLCVNLERRLVRFPRTSKHNFLSKAHTSRYLTSQL